jgi:hypothetical protein
MPNKVPLNTFPKEAAAMCSKKNAAAKLFIKP